MPYSTSSIVGTIAMLSAPRHEASRTRGSIAADDSSLDSLLASLAHCSSLVAAQEGGPLVVVSTRLSRLAGGETAGDILRADLARLLDDLEEEYALLADA